MKIYTKRGDHGRTSILGGKVLAKSDPRLDLLGTLDELNSALGQAASICGDPELVAGLERTQRQLFEAGAALARPENSGRAAEFADRWTAGLEREIDQRSAQLPPLVNFILPGGSPAAAAIHLARSVCRRLERIYFGQASLADAWFGVYLNRLGDWLFVLARAANQATGKADAIWTSEAE
jgi:cob(I)alamin adenosyltransferase